MDENWKSFVPLFTPRRFSSVCLLRRIKKEEEEEITLPGGVGRLFCPFWLWGLHWAERERTRSSIHDYDDDSAIFCLSLDRHYLDWIKRQENEEWAAGKGEYYNVPTEGGVRTTRCIFSQALEHCTQSEMIAKQARQKSVRLYSRSDRRHFNERFHLKNTFPLFVRPLFKATFAQNTSFSPLCFSPHLRRRRKSSPLKDVDCWAGNAEKSVGWRKWERGSLHFEGAKCSNLGLKTILDAEQQWPGEEEEGRRDSRHEKTTTAAAATSTATGAAITCNSLLGGGVISMSKTHPTALRSPRSPHTSKFQMAPVLLHVCVGCVYARSRQ